MQISAAEAKGESQAERVQAGTEEVAAGHYSSLCVNKCLTGREGHASRARSQGRRLLSKSIRQQIGQFAFRQSVWDTAMARMMPSCSNITWPQSLRRSVTVSQTYGRRLQDRLD